MRQTMNSLIAVMLILLTSARFVSAQVPSTAGAQLNMHYPRPIRLGVGGANAAVWYGTNQTTQSPNNAPSSYCNLAEATLGALVQDQNGAQYILGPGHVLALGPNGFLTSGANTPITQAGMKTEATLNGYTGQQACAYIAQGANAQNGWQGNNVQNDTVAKLSYVVPQFTQITADAAVAQIVPGMVSASIPEIPNYIGYVYEVTTPIKKGIEVQKVGMKTGFTNNGVLNKVLMRYQLKGCKTQPNGNGDCGTAEIVLKNVEQIHGRGFSDMGDSGALVVTRATCEPQPVGMVEGLSPSGDTIAQQLTPVLQQLNSVSGNTFTMVGTGTIAGCSFPLPKLRQPFYFLQQVSYKGDAFGAFLENVQSSGSNMGYVIDTVTGVESIQDLSVPDPDVVAAYAARTDFL